MGSNNQTTVTDQLHYDQFINILSDRQKVQKHFHDTFENQHKHE